MEWGFCFGADRVGDIFLFSSSCSMLTREPGREFDQIDRSTALKLDQGLLFW